MINSLLPGIFMVRLNPFLKDKPQEPLCKYIWKELFPPLQNFLDLHLTLHQATEQLITLMPYGLKSYHLLKAYW